MLTPQLEEIRNALIRQNQAEAAGDIKVDLLHFLTYLDEIEEKLSKAYENKDVLSVARVIIKPGSKCGICTIELETCGDCGRFIKPKQ